MSSGEKPPDRMDHLSNSTADNCKITTPPDDKRIKLSVCVCVCVSKVCVLIFALTYHSAQQVSVQTEDTRSSTLLFQAGRREVFCRDEDGSDVPISLSGTKGNNVSVRTRKRALLCRG